MFTRASRSGTVVIASHLRRPVSSFRPIMATAQPVVQAKRAYSSVLTSVHTDKAYAREYTYWIRLPTI